MFSQRKSQGFTLIELAVAITILSILTIYSLQEKIYEAEQLQAKRLGIQLYEYNNAVRAFISENPGVVGVFNGVNWLKSLAECNPPAVADQHYINCNYPPRTRLGRLTFTTIIAANAGVTTGTTVLAPLQQGGNVRADLAGIATLMASSGAMSSFTRPVAAAPGTIQFSVDPQTAIITMVAGRVAGNDIWLRTDGSNDMEANLNFDPANPANLRGIANVATIANSPGQILTLNSQVLATSNVSIAGRLDVQGAIRGQSTLETLSDITAGQDLIAKRDLDVTRNARIRGLLVADSNVSVAGNLTVTGQTTDVVDLNASGDVAIAGTTQLDGILTANQPATFNDIVTLDSSKVQLSDRGNMPLATLLPNLVHKDSFLVSDGSPVIKPPCPNGGTPRIYLNVGPVRLTAFVSGNWPPVGDAVLNLKAIDLGASWSVVLESYDPIAQAFVTTAGWAVAQTACAY